MNHEVVEKNIGLMAVLIAVVISVGGLVEIVPLFAQSEVTEPVEGLEPYSAVHLAGRDIYVREGCYVCHSQQVRPFRSETERFQAHRSRPCPRGGSLQRRLAPRAPGEPARCRAGVEHARLSVDGQS